MIGLLPLLIGTNILAWLFYVPVTMHGVADFRTLYASGYLLRTGHSGEIYNDSELEKVKEKLAPLGWSFPLPMDHLAYESVLFAPLSFLSYRKALTVFIVLNLGMVWLCYRLLKPCFLELNSRWRFLPVLLFAAFFPITRTIVQGQDSVILLTLLAVALIWLRRGNDIYAGLFTGLGMFKLQIVIPIAIMFVLWRRWKFVAGFIVSSITALACTTLIVGMHGMQEYISMLLGMSLRLRTNSDAVRYSISPLTMVNLRGFFSAMLEGRLPHIWLQVVIVLCSLGVLLLSSRLKPSMGTAILAAALVSYHLNVQDASILMIPIGMALCGESKLLATSAVAMFVISFVAVMPLWGFWASIPIMAMFLSLSFDKNAACAMKSA